MIIIHAKAEQVITQTYHDPQGDVDSLETEMQVVVDGISAKQINSIYQNLNLIQITLGKAVLKKGK